MNSPSTRPTPQQNGDAPVAVELTRSGFSQHGPDRPFLDPRIKDEEAIAVSR
jgi:hypothetical protein